MDEYSNLQQAPFSNAFFASGFGRLLTVLEDYTEKQINMEEHTC